VSTLVTAIVAAYNEERHIGECVASLLAQRYAPLDILVVDDGSTDHTVEAVPAHLRVQVLRRAHAGKAPAVNAAAEAARGEILLFLDGDLVLDPDYVRTLVAPILSGEETGTAHGTELVANPQNRWARCLQAKAGLPPDRRLALTDAQVAAGSIVYRAVRRDDFIRVGGFDDTGYLDDQTLFPKLGRRARFVPEAVCHHYNPERLSEVLAAGVWGAHSILLLHGPRALLHYLPPLSLARALRAGRRARSPERVLYDFVSECGIFWGLLVRTIHRRGRRRG
jgi:glycosyltransferase involved in cell wall biosynthesis